MFDLHQVSGHPETAGKGPVVELQHEIAAADLVRHNRAGNVEPPILIGLCCQALCRHHPYSRQAFLARILEAVSIHVIEDLAKNVSAVERLIRDDTNGCGRLTRQGLARPALDDLRAVDELAFANTGADCEQQHDRAMIVSCRS